jgi:phosphoribosyl 1,2-cyclic phosphodiesterase
VKVTFYGTRGSVPVCSPNRCSEFGGNTSCILLTFGNGRIAILDAGTGIRQLGNDLLESSVEQFDNIFIAFSHTHWDHIQGFPFFKPAYDPRRQFTLAIHGQGGKENRLKNAFQDQMRIELFPVPLEEMGATLLFWEPDLPAFRTRGVHVTASRHNHPGGAYGYRFTEEGKTLVYCTDVEHGDDIDPAVVELARDADLLIHDGQYTPDELGTKKGWGHSSWAQAVEVAERAGVKRLALFHHDPDHSDEMLLEIEKQSRERFPASFLAREGQVVDL